MVLALLAIPLCFLKSGGRDVENMRHIRSLVRHVKYFLGLRFDVSGWEHLQTEGPYVIISNHQSSLDVLGLMEILPDRCTMIAKKELIYAGTVGLICWLGGIVFINRKKPNDAKSVMIDASKTMLDDKIRLWVFPEGTRNQTGNLLPFKKGAFHLAVQAQVPIIPIVFSSYSSFYLRKQKQFNSGTIRIKILPKIETKGLTSDDIPSLIDKSFDLMNSSFLSISNFVPHSNGPCKHWTFTTLPSSSVPSKALPSPPDFPPSPPQVVPSPGQEMTQLWNLLLSGGRPELSTVGPDPQRISSRAAPRVEWRTAGRQYRCMLFFVHAFWMALSTSIRAFSLALIILTSYFITILYFLFFGLFSPLTFFCSADNPWLFYVQWNPLVLLTLHLFELPSFTH